MAAENLIAGRRLTDRMRDLDLSDRELAKRVMAVWREPGRKRSIKKPDGLAVKVGQLRKGNITWWLKHHAAQRALAEVLEWDVAELEIRDGGGDPELRFQVEDLPDLAIDLRTERLYVLGQPNWFATDWFALARTSWIEAPPGAGKSLATQWHAARGNASMLRVVRLADAVDRIPDGPVILDVESADPQSDRGALRSLGARAQLLVLAPFSPPENDERAGPASEQLGRPPPTAAPERRWGFSVHGWQPDPSWRAVFLGWIAERQRQGREWAKRVLTWINELDPAGDLFATPGALLPLLRFVWTETPRRFRPSHFVEDWLTSSIGRVAGDRSPCSLWLHAHGVAVMRALIEARFADAWLQWQGGLPRARWTACIPASHGARLAGDAVRRELEALCETSPRQRPKKLEETARRLDQPSTEEAIQYLVSARLLRTVGLDRLDVHPRWVAEWHARDHVAAVIGDVPPAEWGRWCVDEARRPFVDAALDGLDDAGFGAVARRALDEWSATVLGCVGAVEALFCAVARRVRRGAAPLGGTNLRRLWQLQLQLLQQTGSWRPEPLTRPGPRGQFGGHAEWVACCWTWSLRIARWSTPIPEDLAWLFPGWTRPRLSVVPHWLRSIYLQHEGGRDQRVAWDWLYGLTRSIVEHCEDADLPSNVPEILFPEILRASRRKGWKITRQHYPYGDEIMQLAVTAVTSLPETEQEAIARELWQALLANEGDFYPLRDVAPKMFDFIVQRLDEEDVRDAVRRKKLEFDLLDPRKEGGERRLPLPLWLAALDELLVVGSPPAYALREMEAWPRWTGPIVEALIGKDPAQRDWRGIRILWAVDPDRALTRAAAAYPDDANARYWITEGWQFRPVDILRLLEASPHRPLPDWARRWLASRLLDLPGQGVDQIFALLAESA